MRTSTTANRPPRSTEQRKDAQRPIGLFDSGVGGLSVLRAIVRELPHEDLVYFADQKYCPYGLRPPEEIRARAQRIVEFLLAQNCKAIVVACNTASAAALYPLRLRFPQIPIVGMEPAVKPAAQASHSGKIAVLATRGTLNGELFARTRAAYAQDVEVLVVHPRKWVERVERGEIDSPRIQASVRRVLEPLLDAGVDEIALGCTHYPFLLPLLEQIAGGRARIIDPSDAVARQTARVLEQRHLLNPQHALGSCILYTGGSRRAFAATVAKLLGDLSARIAHAELP